MNFKNFINIMNFINNVIQLISYFHEILLQIHEFFVVWKSRKVSISLEKSSKSHGHALKSLLSLVHERSFFTTIEKISQFWPLFTLLENLKLCPKIHFRKNNKIVNMNFCGKNEWFFCDNNTLISFRFWIFTPKIV